MYDGYWEREYHENPEPAKDLNKDQYIIKWCCSFGTSLRRAKGQVSIYTPQRETKSITYY